MEEEPQIVGAYFIENRIDHLNSMLSAKKKPDSKKFNSINLFI